MREPTPSPRSGVRRRLEGVGAGVSGAVAGWSGGRSRWPPSSAAPTCLPLRSARPFLVPLAFQQPSTPVLYRPVLLTNLLSLRPAMAEKPKSIEELREKRLARFASPAPQSSRSSAGAEQQQRSRSAPPSRSTPLTPPPTPPPTSSHVARRTSNVAGQDFPLMEGLGQLARMLQHNGNSGKPFTFKVEISFPGQDDKPPAVTEVEPPAVTEVEPPAATEVEPPAATEVEPPAATEVEPPAATVEEIVDLTDLDEEEAVEAVLLSLRDMSDDDDYLDAGAVVDDDDDEAFEPRRPVPLLPPRAQPKRLSLSLGGPSSKAPRLSQGTTAGTSGASSSTSTPPASTLRAVLNSALAQQSNNLMFPAAAARAREAQRIAEASILAPAAPAAVLAQPQVVGAAAVPAQPQVVGAAAVPAQPQVVGAAAVLAQPQVVGAAAVLAQPQVVEAAAVPAQPQAAVPAQPQVVAGPPPNPAGPPPNPAEDLICSICLERPFQARLACHHMFCIECLERQRQARRMKCGLCRRGFKKWKPLFG